MSWLVASVKNEGAAVIWNSVRVKKGLTWILSENGLKDCDHYVDVLKVLLRDQSEMVVVVNREDPLQSES